MPEQLAEEKEVKRTDRSAQQSLLPLGKDLDVRPSVVEIGSSSGSIESTGNMEELVSSGTDEPLYLVDGSGYIFRAFFAIAPLTNNSGMPTNALYGFTRMLGKLLRDVRARYIAVTFDTKEPTFRHELYAEYKANREECPAELIPQMPYFRTVTKALGVSCLEKPGVEADDIIATLAHHFRDQGRKVVIVSGDKDLLQLVDQNVSVVDAMRDITFTPAEVREKFGVGPEQMRDYLSLVGDTSDNVPGIKGIGPKTASRLLQHFGSIERMLENPSEIETISDLRGAKGIRQKLESGMEGLRLSQRLIDLDAHVEPFDRIGSVEEFSWQQPPTESLRPLFEELQFTSLLSTFGNGESKRPPPLTSSKSFRVVREDEIETIAESLAAHGSFAFDVETSSLDVLTADLLGISVSAQEGEGWYLPIAGANAKDSTLSWDRVVRAFSPIFGDPTCGKAGVNLKFDIGVLAEKGIEVAGVKFDAMLCSHLLHPDSRQNGLKALALRYLDERMVTYEELVEGYPTLDAVPLERVAHYACHDAEASFALWKKMDPLLGERVGRDPGAIANAGASEGDRAVGAPADTSGEAPSLRRAFEDVEMPLVPVLSLMERRGIKVDIPFLDELSTRFSEELRGLEARIYVLAGKEFNINSPKQLGGILFDEMKLPTKGVKKTQHGYSTDASVLSGLSDDHEIARELLEYRELHKLNSTYVEALRRIVHPRTGRIHTSFNQAIAATGRLSSTDPNLQNIPIKNARGRLIRRAFIAEPGCVLLSVDYSQIELRILAHLSGDRNLCAAFRNNEDIHRKTAEEMFGLLPTSPEEMKELRRVAKTINFGIIYGMGAFRLGQELGISRKQAQEYIDNYFARYPSVQLYFDTLKRDIETRGYVETLFGRRRHKHEVDTSGRDAGYAERSLLNAPIQGSAAEVMKVAMIQLHERLASRREVVAMILQVHDELVFEVKSEQVPEVRELVVETMETAVPLGVPLRVDVRCGKSWGEDVW